MISIQILESTDRIRMDDWVRHLEASSLTRNQDCDFYLKWQMASQVIDRRWMNKTLQEFYSNNSQPHYEFARGRIPENHCVKKREDLVV